MGVCSVALGFDLSLECVEDMVLVQEDLTAPLQEAGVDPFWTDPTEIRVVLKDFPVVEEVFLQRVYETVHHIASRLVPFKVSMRGVLPFPSATCPRLLCADIELGMDLVEGLWKVLELHLERIGVDRDLRTFRPVALLGRGATHGPRVDLTDLMSGLELHEKAFRSSYVKDLAVWSADPRGCKGWEVVKRFRLGGRREV